MTRAQRQLGPWSLGRALGVGGNGTVWRANSPAGAAAIKTLTRAGARHRQRFLREIETLRALAADPNVLRIIDAATADAEPLWFTMPIAVPLLQRFGANPPVEDVVACISDCAGTLHRIASEPGVFHRDLKPENLFWYEGRWTLGDFGLAARRGDDAGVTRPGERLGPMYYIAPEMLEDASRADAGPADVYSLAKCLWKLVTGQKYPMQGEIRIDVAAMRLESAVEHPRIQLLNRVLEAATRHDPSTRLRMGDLRDELRARLEPPAPAPARTPVDLAALRHGIEAATARSQREAEAVAGRIAEMNAAVGRLTDAVRTVERRLRDAGFESIAVAHGGPEIIYNVPPLSDAMRARFGGARWSGGFSIGLDAPGGQPPHLYAGIGVQANDHDALYIVAKYAIVGDRFTREGETIWCDEDLIAPDTANATAAEARLAAGVGNSLGVALDRYRAVLEARQ
ncbi:MAG: protein kinase domain-containing protein [Candidatus Dormibacteria bacterium]